MGLRLPVLAVERTGECTRCGDCCRGDPFVGERGPPAIPGMCPLFRTGAGGEGVCSDRTDGYYRRACAGWPYGLHNLADYARCGYSFVEVR